MKKFLILFREPDGRKDVHTDEDIKQHREAVGHWMNTIIAQGSLLGVELR